MKDPGSISLGETSIESASPAPVGSDRVASVEIPPARDWLPKRPGVETDEPMSEAGRKILRFHFQRMVYNEPGTRLGEDIEALHDMRVATRRMRAAFRVFGTHYHTKEILAYLKGLKRTGRALGAVRDLDVFQAKVYAYLDTLPESQKGGLDSLLEVLEARRSTARDQMITYLDSEKYRRFVAHFDRFVETPGVGSLPISLCDDEPRPYRVRHVAPTSIYQRLENVLAYDEWIRIPDPPLSRLHALRIACKRLRYTLEFFREVLGPDTGIVIKEVVVIQDHLGALQDTVVASSILRDHLCQGMRDQQSVPEHLSDHEEVGVSPGVAAYLAAQQAEMQHLLETFPGVWQKITGARLSQLVARAVMAM